MATIKDITKKTKTITDVLVKQVVNAAPIKTGRLRKALKSANTVNTVFDLNSSNSKIIPLQSFEFSIDYAPDDAPYGKYWNEPTLASNVKNGKTKNIPKSINFVEKAILTPEFQKGLDDIIDLIGETIAANIVIDIDR
jgi:hypothetical protein